MVGILNRGRRTVAKLRDELLAALADDSPYVRIASALALGRHGERADQRRAVDCLLELAPWTPDGDVFVSMAAQNAIDKLDDKAAYAVDAIKAFPSKGGRSPDGRYNGYVGSLLKKTLADLDATSNPAPRRNRSPGRKRKQ